VRKDYGAGTLIFRKERGNQTKEGLSVIFQEKRAKHLTTHSSRRRERFPIKVNSGGQIREGAKESTQTGGPVQLKVERSRPDVCLWRMGQDAALSY